MKVWCILEISYTVIFKANLCCANANKGFALKRSMARAFLGLFLLWVRGVHLLLLSSDPESVEPAIACSQLMYQSSFRIWKEERLSETTQMPD